MPALDGLKVVDVGLLVQGPQAAATLLEWGADVVKVELPGFGDQSRWLPVQEGDTRSGYFAACNRGKRSVTLDLRVPDGREVFLRLIDQSDVVISNFKPGTMEGWGLGYEVLAARNPRLVYAAGSTFGQVGVNAHREGADLAGQAAGGLISTTGSDGGSPTPVAATIADHIGSQNILSGVLAALLARERTGHGQQVETSLVGGQIWAQAAEYTTFLITGRSGLRANGGHPLIPGLYGIFPTQDGWIALVGVIGAARTNFFELIGHPELAAAFPEIFYWDTEKAALFPQIGEAMTARTTAEWCEILGAAGVRFAPVRDYAQVVEDPDVWANGYLARVGDTPVVAAPVRFSATPGGPSGDVPELGQHTEEVLLELGYSWDDIARLAAASVT